MAVDIELLLTTITVDLDVGDFHDSVTIRESDVIDPLVYVGSIVEMTGDLLVYVGSRVEMIAEDELPSDVVTIGSDELPTSEDIKSDELEVIKSDEEGMITKVITAAKYRHLDYNIIIDIREIASA